MGRKPFPAAVARSPAGPVIGRLAGSVWAGRGGIDTLGVDERPDATAVGAPGRVDARPVLDDEAVAGNDATGSALVSGVMLPSVDD